MEERDRKEPLLCRSSHAYPSSLLRGEEERSSLTDRTNTHCLSCFATTPPERDFFCVAFVVTRLQTSSRYGGEFGLFKRRNTHSLTPHWRGRSAAQEHVDTKNSVRFSLRKLVEHDSRGDIFDQPVHSLEESVARLC